MYSKATGTVRLRSRSILFQRHHWTHSNPRRWQWLCCWLAGVKALKVSG